MVLGILGGGQLGRMTAFAAARLGVDVRVLAPSASGPTAPLAHVTVGDWEDASVLGPWAEACDVVTVESEWAPADRVPAGVPVRPGVEALVAIRHKGRQRARLAEHGLPQPAHVWAATRGEALAALERFGAVVCKRFEGSYDGYGNATCRTEADVQAAWDDLSAEDGLLVEAFVPFEAEAAVTVARRPTVDGRGGAAVVYPVVRSEHRDHRLWAAWAPAGFPESVEAEARRVALATVEALDVVGVATVEVFVAEGGAVLVNEVAPRPHNTAHLTIDASHTSQFENHVRAVLDWPLGDPGLRVPAACVVNVLGEREGGVAPGLSDALAVDGASVHLYGKTEVRPARKMGHVTATAPTVEAARERAEAAAEAVRL
ncbi:5-(carboxyamino)imidazole ribonucleotide synthase [Rubrivirga litoralis]|uniref:N5-carboxyaminoimidazole ribonucleotide synthase n=1 Tax=Rubrivirga litoralis TaxID=3075598 RepID=A0ABU3BMW0_9BACT|nr:5-(carboxyamino)imidazole ribonucleotide synthase [Rubrivirga sp. F394]MDT0630624.1 5-(carboxyamino)imidazole ribonucleotide synthase [Rubrivirga sp. F394]